MNEAGVNFVRLHTAHMTTVQDGYCPSGQNEYIGQSVQVEVQMSSFKEFRPVGEVSADDRARIAFGKAGVRRDDRYAMAVTDDGEILLTPLVSIPKRELLVWQDQDLRAELGRALEEKRSGELNDLGSFSSYAEDDELESTSNVRA